LDLTFHYEPSFRLFFVYFVLSKKRASLQ
jgi:hypothetical protein